MFNDGLRAETSVFPAFLHYTGESLWIWVLMNDTICLGLKCLLPVFWTIIFLVSLPMLFYVASTLLARNVILPSSSVVYAFMVNMTNVYVLQIVGKVCHTGIISFTFRLQLVKCFVDLLYQHENQGKWWLCYVVSDICITYISGICRSIGLNISPKWLKWKK